MKEQTRRKRERRERTRFDAYRERDALLLQIGFSNYDAYRKSDLWKGIRTRVLERDNGKCTCCKVKDARHVHHTKYDMETLRGERLETLTSLCAGCHKTIEFAKWGKTGLAESGKRLRRRTKRKTRELCYETDAEYRSLKFRLKHARRTMPVGPERSAIMSEIRRKMREKERQPGTRHPVTAEQAAK